MGCRQGAISAPGGLSQPVMKGISTDFFGEAAIEFPDNNPGGRTANPSSGSLNTRLRGILSLIWIEKLN